MASARLNFLLICATLKSNSYYLIYLPFLQWVCRELSDRGKKSYRFQHLQSTIKFSSGRKDKNRKECDNLETESFPINVETLVNLFTLVLFIYES